MPVIVFFVKMVTLAFDVPREVILVPVAVFSFPENAKLALPDTLAVRDKVVIVFVSLLVLNLAVAASVVLIDKSVKVFDNPETSIVDDDVPEVVTANVVYVLALPDTVIYIVELSLQER